MENKVLDKVKPVLNEKEDHNQNNQKSIDNNNNEESVQTQNSDQNQNQINENNEQKLNFFEIIDNLETLIKNSVDWMKNSSDYEENFIKELDQLIEESLALKDKIQNESKVFVDQLKSISHLFDIDFNVDNIEMSSDSESKQ